MRPLDSVRPTVSIGESRIGRLILVPAVITLAVTLLLFWLGRNLLHGRLGYAMTAIRDNSIAAAAMGINVSLCKTITFAISATYTGIAGALAPSVARAAIGINISVRQPAARTSGSDGRQN